MSRYQQIYETCVLYFTDEEWLNFIREIQTNCKFVASLYYRHDRTVRRMCDKTIIVWSYYDELNDVFKFLTSNDDRRKIVKYLDIEIFRARV